MEGSLNLKYPFFMSLSLIKITHKNLEMRIPAALLAKNLNAYFRFIKRSLSSDDLHRPSASSTAAFAFNPTFDYASSASNGDSDAELDVAYMGGASTPDFSSIYASPRFFVSSPGRSNSILDSATFSLAAVVEDLGITELDGERGEVVEVQRESPDPYADFRRSMEETVEARELHDVPANWQSLQELLLRYLSVNPEPNHKFIAGAFADVLVSLMSPPPSSSDGDITVCGEAPAAVASCSAYY